MSEYGSTEYAVGWLRAALEEDFNITDNRLQVHAPHVATVLAALAAAEEKVAALEGENYRFRHSDHVETIDHLNAELDRVRAERDAAEAQVAALEAGRDRYRDLFIDGQEAYRRDTGAEYRNPHSSALGTTCEQREEDWLAACRQIDQLEVTKDAWIHEAHLAADRSATTESKLSIAVAALERIDREDKWCQLIAREAIERIKEGE